MRLAGNNRFYTDDQFRHRLELRGSAGWAGAGHIMDPSTNDIRMQVRMTDASMSFDPAADVITELTPNANTPPWVRSAIANQLLANHMMLADPAELPPRPPPHHDNTAMACG